MSELFRRYGSGITYTAIGLTAFWLLVLVIFPYAGLFEQSFRPYLPVTEINGPNDHYFFNNYLVLFSNPQNMTFGIGGFETTTAIPIHLWVFFITILYSSLATLFVLLICYPVAYCLAKVMPSALLPSYLLLLIIPLWVSELMRSFSWYIILSLKGPLTIVLQSLGIITDPIHWTWGMNGYSGIIVGLIYTYILFMLFPIYNAMTSLDSNQIEAAEDLGAGIFKTHWRVVMPHCKPGIASGCVTVFMLSAGSLLVPSLLASPKSRWFTEVIQQWMFETHDWNAGAAYAFILLFTCTVFVTLMLRLFKVGFADIAK